MQELLGKQRKRKKGRKKERRKEKKEGRKGRKKTESCSKSFKEFKGALKMHCLNTLFYWWGHWSPESLTGLPNPARISKAEIQLYNLPGQFSTHPNCHYPVANTVVSIYPVLLKSAAAAAVAAKSLQSCPTLCNPRDSSPPRLPGPWDSPGKNTGTQVYKKVINQWNLLS